ncbi:hypothetical protein RR46_05419 [Papilio xuthus]|uniref:Uncharacterized protein n=1 Tax=Papilio xuthus TaxID=66420 RepID=A0A194Q765_PAPXU|nr:hypothetical protein RR46_05419 [Papilio xuthus]
MWERYWFVLPSCISRGQTCGFVQADGRRLGRGRLRKCSHDSATWRVGGPEVKTHIPFEPRWTVQYCLFGCDTNSNATATTGSSGTFLEQVVVEEGHRQAIQPQQIHAVGGVRQQQYVLATPGQPATPVSQVIFCGGGVGSVSGVGGAAPVITSVLPAGGAVLTPHHTLHQ